MGLLNKLRNAIKARLPGRGPVVPPAVVLTPEQVVAEAREAYISVIEKSFTAPKNSMKAELEAARLVYLKALRVVHGKDNLISYQQIGVAQKEARERADQKAQLALDVTRRAYIKVLKNSFALPKDAMKVEIAAAHTAHLEALRVVYGKNSIVSYQQIGVAQEAAHKAAVEEAKADYSTALYAFGMLDQGLDLDKTEEAHQLVEAKRDVYKRVLAVNPLGSNVSIRDEINNVTKTVSEKAEADFAAKVAADQAAADKAAADKVAADKIIADKIAADEALKQARREKIAAVFAMPGKGIAKLVNLAKKAVAVIEPYLPGAAARKQAANEQAFVKARNDYSKAIQDDLMMVALGNPNNITKAAVKAAGTVFADAMHALHYDLPTFGMALTAAEKEARESAVKFAKTAFSHAFYNMLMKPEDSVEHEAAVEKAIDAELYFLNILNLVYPNNKTNENEVDITKDAVENKIAEEKEAADKAAQVAVEKAAAEAAAAEEVANQAAIKQAAAEAAKQARNEKIAAVKNRVVGMFNAVKTTVSNFFAAIAARLPFGKQAVDEVPVVVEALVNGEAEVVYAPVEDAPLYVEVQPEVVVEAQPEVVVEALVNGEAEVVYAPVEDAPLYVEVQPEVVAEAQPEITAKSKPKAKAPVTPILPAYNSRPKRSNAGQGVERFKPGINNKKGRK